MNKIKYAFPLLWKHNIIGNTIKINPMSSKIIDRVFINSNKTNILNFSNRTKIKKVKCYSCNCDINIETLVPLCCQSCKALISVDVFKIFNFFELFDIEPTYDIDKNILKKKFNDIQKIYHPDRNSQNPEMEKVNEVSSYINNAYKTLLNDIDRAIYIMDKKYNYKIHEEENLEDEQFLFEIVEINEEINNPDANIVELAKKYKDKYQDHVEKIKLYFKQKDFDNVINALKRLKFINRILDRLQNI
ncbi:chaperone, putative [Plasmodium yoelii]|nr:chaperone, putative [Plasmodium yoelii]CDU17602.1 chaperone protein, putative [Plasmodium yoelii]VTZ77482.1 chaperone, putative [Plasmodium yoelii]|eukprot:XP_022811975.1 chaperone, putative [Plasmodium yoelii]